MLGKHYLQDVLSEFHKYKEMSEKALAQIDDKQLFVQIGEESNSIAITMKHMTGNMFSRWTDFLTSDGEKAFRKRDTEFELEDADTREHLMKRWEAGWACLFAAIEPLQPEDLEKTITIRAEPHTVLQAINRQMTHYAYHVGQIVYVARHLVGDKWQSLSIPKGQSEQYDVSRLGDVSPHEED